MRHYSLAPKRIGIIALLLVSGNLAAENPATSSIISNSNIETPGLSSQEVTMLKSSTNEDFLCLWKPAAAQNNTQAALILHNDGGHPNEPGAIRFLRTTLPKYQISTLSINVPELGNNSGQGALSAQIVQDNNESRATAITTGDKVSFEEAEKSFYSRFSTAITYLKSQKINQVIVIAQGTSASFAASVLKNHPTPECKGIILISAIALDAEHPKEESQLIKDAKLPCLDVYGSHDLTIIRSWAEYRLSVMKANPSHPFPYVQKRIEGANFRYTGQYDSLEKAVMTWCKMLKFNIKTSGV